MNSTPPEEIKQYCVESLDPALIQLLGQSENCTFAKRKVKPHNPITNEFTLK